MSGPVTEDVEVLRRREVLRRAAWLLGGAVSAPLAVALLQGCGDRKAAEAPKAADAPLPVPWAPKFLNAAQLALVSEIAEIMIPRTDTGGARDAGVPQFVDLMLADVYKPEDQQRFLAGLAAFEAGAGKGFLEQAAAQRVQLVKSTLEAELEGERIPKPFMLATRELVLVGFFNSKIGVTEFTDYRPVPVEYHGCVPLSKMRRHVEWEP
jgi:gluconate 2-dehydrogenase gamma chain